MIEQIWPLVGHDIEQVFQALDYGLERSRDFRPDKDWESGGESDCIRHEARCYLRDLALLRDSRLNASIDHYGIHLDFGRFITIKVLRSSWRNEINEAWLAGQLPLGIASKTRSRTLILNWSINDQGIRMSLGLLALEQNRRNLEFEWRHDIEFNEDLGELVYRPIDPDPDPDIQERDEEGDQDIAQ